MKPLYERILLKPIEKETKTKSGILLPGKAVKRPNIGTVVACGEGTSHNPMKVKEGDIVLCNRYAGIDIVYQDSPHYVIMSNEVIAVLDSVDEVKLDEYE
jgi:chaperonin GroES